MKVHVISKGRAGKAATLSLFHPDNALIYVEPQEVEAYSRFYGKQVVSIGESDRGISFARNAIIRKLKAEGETKVIILDDDAKGFFIREGKKYVKLIKADCIIKQIERLLDKYDFVTIPWKSYAWTMDGLVYPKHTISPLYGIRLDKCDGIEFDESLRLFEDYDFAIHLYKAGIISATDYSFALDFHWYNPKAPENNDGGMSIHHKSMSREEVFHQLERKWGANSIRVYRDKEGWISSIGPIRKRNKKCTL